MVVEADDEAPQPVQQDIDPVQREIEMKQRLKIQFAKHDLNRDGLLTATEFSDAFRSTSHAVLPELTKIPMALANASYTSNADQNGIDINGFIKSIEALNIQAKRMPDKPLPKYDPPPAYDGHQKRNSIKTLRGAGAIVANTIRAANRAVVGANVGTLAKNTVRGVANWFGALDESHEGSVWGSPRPGLRADQSRVGAAFGWFLINCGVNSSNAISFQVSVRMRLHLHTALLSKVMSHRMTRRLIRSHPRTYALSPSTTML